MESDSFKNLGKKILDVASNVIVVSTIGQDNNKRYTMKTLELLGILNTAGITSKRVVTFYDAPNIVRDNLYKSVCKSITCGGANYFNITLNWYYALKAAQRLFETADKKYIMFLENDCCILKNTAKAAQLLDNIPDDADFVNFNAAMASAGPGIPKHLAIGKYKKMVPLRKQHFLNMLNNPETGNKYFAEILTTVRSFNCIMMNKQFCNKFV